VSARRSGRGSEAPFLVRVRLESPTLRYYAPLDRSADGPTVLQVALGRLREWYGRACLAVLSDRERWRFVGHTAGLDLMWCRSTVDADSCLEAMTRGGFSEAILCYPEFAWHHDTQIPVRLPPRTVAARVHGNRSVLWLDGESLGLLVSASNALGASLGSLAAAAAALRQLPQMSQGKRRFLSLAASVPWNTGPSLVLDNRGAVGPFLEHSVRAQQPTNSPKGQTQLVTMPPESVLFVCGTSALGGAEEAMLRFAASLHDRGAATSLSIPLEGLVTERFRAHGGQVVIDNVVRSQPRPDNINYFRALFARIQPSVVHFTGPVGLAPLISASLEGLPSAYHVHWLWPDAVGDELQWSTRILACSNVARDCLIAHGLRPERVLVVRNGIDTRPTPLVAPDDEARPFDVLCLARYSAEKRHDLLLQAIRLILGDRPGLRVLCVGDDIGSATTFPSVKNSVQRLGLEAVVECRPFVRDPSSLLAAARCLVLASDTEAAPLVVLEAMAAGLPVVASRIAAMEEIIADSGAAALFEPSDARACAKALADVLSDGETRRLLAQNGYSLVGQRYSARQSCDDMIAALAEATSVGAVGLAMTSAL
jgi:glycosyltransferase involved in cell wall biosynthesis